MKISFKKTQGWVTKHSDILSVLGIFVAWRVVLEILAQYANYRFAFLRPGFEGTYEKLQRMREVWLQWDAGWYHSIIANGYHFTTGEQSNVAFFPLYPYLVKFVSWILHVEPLYFGPILSTILFAGACVLFYKLVLLDFSKTVAHNALLALLVFPTSFYFVSLYTESLFLILLLGSLYAARKNKWWVAGILAFFVALTRNVGILLLPALLFEYFAQREFKLRNIKVDILATALSPLGLLTYALYLYIRFGDFLAFSRVQGAWGRTFEPIWSVVWNDYLPLLIHFSAASISDELRIRFFDLLFAIFGLVVLIIGYRCLRTSYVILATLLFIAPIVTGQLASISRYEIVIFPIFMVMGLGMKWPPLKVAYVALGGFMLFESVILFVTGNWVA